MLVLEVMIMLINEASKITNLTKKAIEYYIEQNLILPDTLYNGYRDFNDKDIECLKKISILRNLGLSTGQIEAVLADENGDELKKLSVQKELITKREAAKNSILDKLSSGYSYADISKELEAIEQNATVTEKLLTAFPGYYGRFICLKFAYYLNEPIITDEQRLAYKEILEFLDKLQTMDFPEDLKTYFDEETKIFSTNDINKMIEKNRYPEAKNIDR